MAYDTEEHMVLPDRHSTYYYIVCRLSTMRQLVQTRWLLIHLLWETVGETHLSVPALNLEGGSL